MAIPDIRQASDPQASIRSTEQRDMIGYLRAKRVLDVCLSATALLLLSPVMLLMALAIKIDTRGPVIFSHERAGYDRRRRRFTTFRMHKFRSMFDKCDQSVHQRFIDAWTSGSLARDPGCSESAKLTSDTRVTRVGRVLRKTSLDELPQLWNVLVGEMSLVGPRPVPLYEVARYQAWHRRRLEATPGITCLWQVKGRGQVSMDEMVRMDLEYLATRSLWVDMKILLLTIPAVLFGHGAA